MKNNIKHTAAIDQRIVMILAVVCLVIAGVMFANRASSNTPGYGENNANHPDGIHYICTNPDTPHKFTLTVNQVSDHHEKNYGQPIICTLCTHEALVSPHSEAPAK